MTATKQNGIIMDMYEFPSKESHEIEMQVARTLTLNPCQGTAGTGSSTEAKILNWKGIRNVKQLLQTSKSQNLELYLGFLKVWVFRAENQMYNLVLYLCSIMSGYEAALGRFRRLRTSLRELRQSNNGMVPIMVHRILALPEMQVSIEQQELNRDPQEALYRNLDFGEVIDSIHEMILHLIFVLMVSVNPSVLERCEQVLGEVEERLDRIEGRIMEGREYVREKVDEEG